MNQQTEKERKGEINVKGGEIKRENKSKERGKRRKYKKRREKNKYLLDKRKK